MVEYEANIGLEVHVQLSTKSKLFCGCSTRFGVQPNSQACPVCLGLPGSLPVLNKQALKSAIKVALALNCNVANKLKFDRKNYFYPDLPKGYQISQFDKPLSYGGYLQIDDERKRIEIIRVHLEEDAGKLVHPELSAKMSLVDFNRAGMPLLEIVSTPQISSPAEAHQYLSLLKSILEYLEISNCNMEEGSLRCDANVSVKPQGSSGLGVKAEVKNMNSFKGVKDALKYELSRQRKALAGGERIIQETRLWNEVKGITEPMRSKEEAHDYRYFPEPDLVPFVIAPAEIETINKEIPELPNVKKERFKKDYLLSEYDAGVLTSGKFLADYFEQCVKLHDKPKQISNWITGEVLAQLNLRHLEIEKLGLSPSHLAELIKMADKGDISIKTAKQILPELIDNNISAGEIVKARGLIQLSDKDKLTEIIDEAIKVNPASVGDYRKGKISALGFLVGQVMKQTKGKANPRMVNEILKERLEE
ncbi:MAG: Asp-tRNA(Asn)/Glu-tRNA(Gln) amidotransferase subunit GatB [Candidatus Omnitrophota bacterium]|nr:Asp-tRNA(Asn)/Glu-tRNA(Gln) amidotransferase subunit GatB [Candidatus Omnitrophota bacterium]